MFSLNLHLVSHFKWFNKGVKQKSVHESLRKDNGNTNLKKYVCGLCVIFHFVPLFFKIGYKLPYLEKKIVLSSYFPTKII